MPKLLVDEAVPAAARSQRKLLIDGDGLVYRCGFAVEKTRYVVTWENGPTGNSLSFFDTHKAACDFMDERDVIGHNECLWTRKTLEPVDNALHLVKQTLDKLKERYPGYDTEIWLSPIMGNFREKVATRAKYKGNRDSSAKPKYYEDIRRYLVGTYSGRVYEGAEADDALSIFNTEGSVIVSLDKDLDQIPGLHYNWVKDEEYTIGKKEGAINLYCQILSGDPTDNIPGIEGIGPKTARKMLEGCMGVHDCWKVVLDAYRSKYGESGESFAIETARLVYLQRRENEIWEPPTKVGVL